MKCNNPKCNNEKPNTANRKWCVECAAKKHKAHKTRWANRNKKYHYDYLKKWKIELKELERSA